jgi:hypothetical protein
MDIAGLDSLLRMAARWVLERPSTRARIRRQLLAIQSAINDCCVLFVRGTQGGTVPQVRLPLGAAAWLPSLYVNGHLSGEELAAIEAVFAPAKDANWWLTAPPRDGPAGSNGAQYLRCLLQGRAAVELRDHEGLTLRDRALAAVSRAITALDRTRL